HVDRRVRPFGRGLAGGVADVARLARERHLLQLLRDDPAHLPSRRYQGRNRFVARSIALLIATPISASMITATIAWFSCSDCVSERMKKPSPLIANRYSATTAATSARPAARRRPARRYGSDAGSAIPNQTFHQRAW